MATITTSIELTDGFSTVLVALVKSSKLYIDLADHLLTPPVFQPTSAIWPARWQDLAGLWQHPPAETERAGAPA